MAAEADAKASVVQDNEKPKEKPSTKKPKKQQTKQGLSTVLKYSAAASIAITAALLAVVLPRPGDLLSGFERVPGETAESQDIVTDEFTRTTISFEALDGTPLGAWFYRPSPVNPDGAPNPRPPLVIMAHGLGGQKDFGLHRYAEAYAYSGFAVLVFDYRTWGGSDGSPRHIASPGAHVQDWAAALQFAMGPTLAGTVDQTKIVLWGTSYAGGHVLTTAATFNTSIKAVIAQVPHLSGPAASKVSVHTRGKLSTIRLGVAGIIDKVRERLGLPPVYVKLAGKHGEVAFMALTEEELTAYFAKHPKVKLGGWNNMAAARLALEAPRYSPIKLVHFITAPVMLIAAKRDSLCPYDVIKAAASRIKHSQLVAYDVDHFSLYLGDVWEDVVARQLAFMCDATDHNCPVATDGQAGFDVASHEEEGWVEASGDGVDELAIGGHEAADGEEAEEGAEEGADGGTIDGKDYGFYEGRKVKGALRFILDADGNLLEVKEGRPDDDAMAAGAGLPTKDEQTRQLLERARRQAEELAAGADDEEEEAGAGAGA